MCTNPMSKNALLAVIAAVAILAAGCGPARHNRQQYALTEAELTSTRPWLTEYFEHWQQEVDLTGEQWPGYSDLGVFPIGNGQVFAYEGTVYPLGTLTNVIGPTYQKGSFLGDIVPLVYLGKEVVAWSTQRVRWVKPGGIVNTESLSVDGLRLTTYDFAPPQLPILCRIMIVSNEGQRAQRGVALALAFGATDGEPTDNGIRVRRGDRVMEGGFLGSRTRVEIGHPELPLPDSLTRETKPGLMGENTPVLRCELGTFQPGDTVAKLAYFVVSEADAQDDDLFALVRGRGFALVDDNYEYWRSCNERTVTVETPDQPEVGELLAISKYLCAVQQAKAGGYSPMDGYTYTWIRDSNGPVRYLSAAGDFESVRRHLEYHFRGCAVAGKIGNNLPLDLDVEQIPEINWSQVPVEPAESSSFVILQHYWYYRQSGDLELIRHHWPMLRRCLLGQVVDERGLLPFHGDETYRFPGYEFFQAGKEVELYVNLETRSADSAFEYVAAAEALAEMADELGKAEEAADYQRRAEKIRQATESYYWQQDRGYYAPAMSDLSDQVQPSPFAPINLRPLWIGYASDTARQRQNVLGALKYLWREDGTIRMTPEFEPYVTMVPGYGLYAVAAMGHPAARIALNGVLAAAEKSGGFAEMNEPDNRPSDEVWGQHRIRPWEGGINAEAILYYLTGMEIDAASGRIFLRPQMPIPWERMCVNNLPVADARLRLEMDWKGITVTRQDQSDLVLTLDLTVPVFGAVARLEGNWQELGGQRGKNVYRYGQHWVQAIGVRLGSGQQVTIIPECSVIYKTPRAFLLAAQPFHWGPPKMPAGTKTVVFTWSKETAQECREKYGPGTVVIDTKLPWPAQFLREALLRVDGRRRVDTLVLDTDYFSGAFKREEFWKDGPGATIVAEFKQAGGQVVEPPVVRERSSRLKGLAR